MGGRAAELKAAMDEAMVMFKEIAIPKTKGFFLGHVIRIGVGLTNLADRITPLFIKCRQFKASMSFLSSGGAVNRIPDDFLPKVKKIMELKKKVFPDMSEEEKKDDDMHVKNIKKLIAEQQRKQKAKNLEFIDKAVNLSVAQVVDEIEKEFNTKGLKKELFATDDPNTGKKFIQGLLDRDMSEEDLDKIFHQLDDCLDQKTLPGLLINAITLKKTAVVKKLKEILKDEQITEICLSEFSWLKKGDQNELELSLSKDIVEGQKEEIEKSLKTLVEAGIIKKKSLDLEQLLEFKMGELIDNEEGVIPIDSFSLNELLEFGIIRHSKSIIKKLKSMKEEEISNMFPKAMRMLKEQHLKNPDIEIKESAVIKEMFKQYKNKIAELQDKSIVSLLEDSIEAKQFDIAIELMKNWEKPDKLDVLFEILSKSSLKEDEIKTIIFDKLKLDPNANIKDFSRLLEKAICKRDDAGNLFVKRFLNIFKENGRLKDLIKNLDQEDFPQCFYKLAKEFDIINMLDDEPFSKKCLLKRGAGGNNILGMICFETARVDRYRIQFNIDYQILFVFKEMGLLNQAMRQKNDAGKAASDINFLALMPWGVRCLRFINARGASRTIKTLVEAKLIKQEDIDGISLKDLLKNNIIDPPQIIIEKLEKLKKSGKLKDFLLELSIDNRTILQRLLEISRHENEGKRLQEHVRVVFPHFEHPVIKYIFDFLSKDEKVFAELVAKDDGSLLHETVLSKRYYMTKKIIAILKKEGRLKHTKKLELEFYVNVLFKFAGLVLALEGEEYEGEPILSTFFGMREGLTVFVKKNQDPLISKILEDFLITHERGLKNVKKAYAEGDALNFKGSVDAGYDGYDGFGDGHFAPATFFSRAGKFYFSHHNIGYGSDDYPGSFIIKIDRKLYDSQKFNQLVDKFENQSEETFFTKEELLKEVASEDGLELVDDKRMKYQTVGNCSWVGQKMRVREALMLDKLGDRAIEDKGAVKDARAEAGPLYKKISLFLRVYFMKEAVSNLRWILEDDIIDEELRLKTINIAHDMIYKIVGKKNIEQKPWGLYSLKLAYDLKKILVENSPENAEISLIIKDDVLEEKLTRAAQNVFDIQINKKIPNGEYELALVEIESALKVLPKTATSEKLIKQMKECALVLKILVARKNAFKYGYDEKGVKYLKEAKDLFNTHFKGKKKPYNLFSSKQAKSIKKQIESIDEDIETLEKGKDICKKAKELREEGLVLISDGKSELAKEKLSESLKFLGKLKGNINALPNTTVEDLKENNNKLLEELGEIRESPWQW